MRVLIIGTFDFIFPFSLSEKTDVTCINKRSIDNTSGTCTFQEEIILPLKKYLIPRRERSTMATNPPIVYIIWEVSTKLSKVTGLDNQFKSLGRTGSFLIPNLIKFAMTKDTDTSKIKQEAIQYWLITI